MKNLLILLSALILSLPALAQKTKSANQVAYRSADDWIASKNYYLLTLLKQDKAAIQLLKSDTALSALAAEKINALNSSLKTCKEAQCFIDPLKFSESEIKRVAARLKFLYQPGNALGILVHNKLTPSGCYNIYHVTGSDLLVKAWEQDAGAINYTIGVYAEGKKPNYPNIDSISYNTKSKGYTSVMYDASSVLQGELSSSAIFLEPSLNAALLYLQINERQDPANYEPMITGVNGAAVNYAKTIKWSSYPYTHILVPGAGPDNLTTPLSGEGMLRCRLAAKQYHAGIAPFIMVSGGMAHPYKTKYCEAIEMKRYLTDVLQIPQKAVIVEPHARHTTTNMRNAARLVYAYGIPAGKAALVGTSKSQTDYIMSMDSRCIKELGYVPYKLGKRISETAVEYYPLPDARQIDPDEPLDP